MMRENFPVEGERYQGGMSDGCCFKIDFWNDDNCDEVLSDLREFLDNEGYANVPLPPSIHRLFTDYFLTDEQGTYDSFVWYPIIITKSPYKDCGLHICIFNESYEDVEQIWKGNLR